MATAIFELASISMPCFSSDRAIGDWGNRPDAFDDAAGPSEHWV